MEKEPKLKDLCFEVIQKCPNNCKFCSSNSSIDKEEIISLELFKKTIDHFISNGGIGEVSISGGEPFLHPNLLDMVRYCKSKGIRTVIFTSGIASRKPLTDEEKKLLIAEKDEKLAQIEKYEPWNDRLKKSITEFYNKLLKQPEFAAIEKVQFEQLKEIGLDKIVFDYQAYSEETDNKVMGRRNMLTELQKSIIKAKNSGLEVEAHFIPMKANYKELPDLLECLEIAEVHRISILNFVPQGRGRINREQLMLTSQEKQEFAEIYEKAKSRFKGSIRVGIPLIGKIKHLCTAGTEKLDIRYDGVVLPCPAFKEISAETMEKYGIEFWSIYDDLERITVTGGKREQPLCKQIYGFQGGELINPDNSKGSIFEEIK